MSHISRYVLCDKTGEEGDYEYDSCAEAELDAARWGCAVVERLYSYTDSELLWTPNGEDTWPPADERDAK